MPLSMTGFGESHCQQDDLMVAVEVRTINNRYLKLSLRVSDGYGALEPEIESIIRKRIHRGTVQVTIRIVRGRAEDLYRINAEVLEGYRRQIDSIRQRWGSSEPVGLESLLALPGVVNEDTLAIPEAEQDWPVIRSTLEAAIDAMDRMRLDEGRAMTVDLRANCRQVGDCLTVIQKLAPLVAEGYRTRLEERLNKILAEYQVSLAPGDLIREISLFGERCDISEEIVRLRSHLDQFDAILDSPESCGRKLEFLTQEMFREANTIGSKANDVEIARQVIDIKGAVERIREMIQNVE